MKVKKINRQLHRDARRRLPTAGFQPLPPTVWNHPKELLRWCAHAIMAPLLFRHVLPPLAAPESLIRFSTPNFYGRKRYATHCRY